MTDFDPTTHRAEVQSVIDELDSAVEHLLTRGRILVALAPVRTALVRLRDEPTGVRP